MNQLHPATYLAAIIDGEGYVSWTTPGRQRNRHTQSRRYVAISNTEDDILQRVKDLLDEMEIHYRTSVQGPDRNRKTALHTIYVGTREGLTTLTEQVAPHMASARKREALIAMSKSYIDRTERPSEADLAVMYAEAGSIKALRARLCVGQYQLYGWLCEAGLAGGRRIA